MRKYLTTLDKSSFSGNSVFAKKKKEKKREKREVFLGLIRILNGNNVLASTMSCYVAHSGQPSEYGKVITERTKTRSRESNIREAT